MTAMSLDGFNESWEQALAEIEAGGGKPYAIPAGASDHPLGALRFRSWAREVEAKEAELGVFFGVDELRREAPQLVADPGRRGIKP